MSPKVDFKVKISADAARRIRRLSEHNSALTDAQWISLAVERLSHVHPERFMQALAFIETEFLNDEDLGAGI